MILENEGNLDRGGSYLLSQVFLLDFVFQFIEEADCKPDAL